MRLDHRGAPGSVDRRHQRRRAVLLAGPQDERACAPTETAGLTTKCAAGGGPHASPGATNRVGTTGSPAACASARYRLSVFHSRTAGGLTRWGTDLAHRRNSSRRARVVPGRAHDHEVEGVPVHLRVVPVVPRRARQGDQPVVVVPVPGLGGAGGEGEGRGIGPSHPAQSRSRPLRCAAMRALVTGGAGFIGSQPRRRPARPRRRGDGRRRPLHRQPENLDGARRRGIDFHEPDIRDAEPPAPRSFEAAPPRHRLPPRRPDRRPQVDRGPGLRRAASTSSARSTCSRPRAARASRAS